MDAQQFLNSFNPDQLAQLKAVLDTMTDVSGRSPMRPRQLHDLRLMPTANDPRPTFFWSAVSPRNAVDLGRTTAYPRLMWEASTGKEVTVGSATAKPEENAAIVAAHEARGYVLTPPGNAEAPDPADAMRDLLEGLSEKDRELVLHGARQARLAQIQTGLLELSDEDREALFAAFASEPKRKAS